LSCFEGAPVVPSLRSAKVVTAQIGGGELLADAVSAGQDRHDEFAALIVEPDAGVAAAEAVFELADDVDFRTAVLDLQRFLGLLGRHVEVAAVIPGLRRNRRRPGRALPR
jgi:hypothetical protein